LSDNVRDEGYEIAWAARFCDPHSDRDSKLAKMLPKGKIPLQPGPPPWWRLARLTIIIKSDVIESIRPRRTSVIPIETSKSGFFFNLND
jgi:hypothetical protein